MEMIWFYERTLLELIIAMVKNKKKMQQERYNVNQN